MQKISAMLALSTLMLTFTASAQNQAKPNVLLLYADDLGYGDLRCDNPASKIPTPHLDRLAADGLRFTDGHSSSGICSPSRYAMLTGRYHWRKFHGIVNAFGASVFSSERLTLPEMMRQAGYRTGAIGKWHLGWDWEAIRKPDAKQVMVSRGPNNGPNDNRVAAWPADAFHWDRPIPDGPLAHGFDTYFGDSVINFPPYCWIENDRVVAAPDTMLNVTTWKPIKEGNWECRAGPMLTGWDPYRVLPTLTEKGVQFIAEAAASDKPFFLYFAFPSPHAPIVPNDEFDGKSEAGPYGDFVFETDAAIGKLLAVLDATGEADNTIVIFTADNGAEGYCYERDAKYGHWSSEPFRGSKRDIFEGGHHVPFIVRWPGVTKPGTVSHALLSQIDLMATLAAVVGHHLEPDQAEDSFDFLPVLTEEVESVRDSLVHNTHRNVYGIRLGDWVMLECQDSGNQQWFARHNYPVRAGRVPQLYNLKQDIGQRHNVAQSHPEKERELQQLLHDIRRQGHSAPHARR